MREWAAVVVQTGFDPNDPTDSTFPGPPGGVRSTQRCRRQTWRSGRSACGCSGQCRRPRDGLPARAQTYLGGVSQPFSLRHPAAPGKDCAPWRPCLVEAGRPPAWTRTAGDFGPLDAVARGRSRAPLFPGGITAWVRGCWPERGEIAGSANCGGVMACGPGRREPRRAGAVRACPTSRLGPLSALARGYIRQGLAVLRCRQGFRSG